MFHAGHKGEKERTPTTVIFGTWNTRAADPMTGIMYSASPRPLVCKRMAYVCYRNLSVACPGAQPFTC